MSESAQRSAEAAIASIGLGYDVTQDLRLKYCKRNPNNSRLISIEKVRGSREVVIPGGISIPNVPKSIKCDKGERLRFSSDVISFQQMSEQFNQHISLTGKIPSGYFNSTFGFTSCWQKDASSTKTLALDGIFITYYNVALEKSQTVLCDHVKQSVPSTWDPVALARFIEKFGTHIIVGVKMGGKDVIYMKQPHSSSLQLAYVQQKIKDIADKRFMNVPGQSNLKSEKFEIHEHGHTLMDTGTTDPYVDEDIIFFCKRRGGNVTKILPHHEWCLSVQSDPDVISMSFVPITSLLSGIDGSGFLTHAINLYLRYKPPIVELHQFLEFQLPRMWAPVFSDLPLGPQRKHQSSASLRFSFMGPKLYVNTTPVDVGKRPVTGVRLYLEGKKSNCLAIHLQHLSSLPKVFDLQDEPNGILSQEPSDRRYYEKVHWKSFSHVCTAPVDSDDDLSIVTGAHFEVNDCGFKRILLLRLHFTKVHGVVCAKRPEWAGSHGLIHKSGIISTLISTHFTTGGQKSVPRLSEVNINSAVYPGGPPQATQARKLLRFVDTTEMTRGPQDVPGYWVVSGARLLVEKGKISLKIKYSLLMAILPDEEAI